MAKKRDDGSQWKIRCLEDKVNTLNGIIESYKLQEEEYLDYIEGLEDRVELYKKGADKMKSQKEEIERARIEANSLYNKHIIELEAQVKSDKEYESLLRFSIEEYKKDIEELLATVGALKVEISRRDKALGIEDSCRSLRGDEE